MSAMAKLKLVAAHAEKRSPMILDRAKLPAKIDHQIAAGKATIAGSTYAATRMKFVQYAESGSRKQVKIATRVQQWCWKAANGKLMLALRCGSKPMELAKSKNAIEIGSMEELVAALAAVKHAIAAGGYQLRPPSTSARYTVDSCPPAFPTPHT